MKKFTDGNNPSLKISTDLHIHSCWSFDSNTEVKAIIQRGRDSGMKYLGVTDHCFIIDRDVANLLDRWEKTSDLDWDGLTVWFGVELSIEAPVIMRSLSCGLYDFLDLVIGGVHGFPKYQLYLMTDEAGSYQPYIEKFKQIMQISGLERLAHEYLEISKKAISLNKLDILVHPWDLFVFAGVTDPLLLDMSVKLAQFAARHDVLIEINNGIFTGLANAFSEDYCEQAAGFYRKFTDICRLEGAGFAPGSDAHLLEDVAWFASVTEIFDAKIIMALNSAPDFLLQKKRRK